MTKHITPRTHGAIDYAVVALLLLAPHLFAFGGTPALICYIVGVAQLGMSLITAYPLGMLKMIPFPAHGQLETIAAVALIGMPWFAGFSVDSKACWFFVLTGISLLAVVAVTDYRSVDARDWFRKPAPRPV
ncbi:MAG: hypothetical protein H0V44_06595 [Planctomycetes bacterium]|nr:hypothetical protein [Planctomycetota bacterium]